MEYSEYLTPPPPTLSTNNSFPPNQQPYSANFGNESTLTTHPTPNADTRSSGLAPSDNRTQLFVGNLPFRVRWQDVKDLFRKAGVVLRANVQLTNDSRSRGHGTVLFARREDAERAVELFNGFHWQTRILDVHLDMQDPQGIQAISEANRQTALQQQANHYQQIQSQQFQPQPPIYAQQYRQIVPPQPLNRIFGAPSTHPLSQSITSHLPQTTSGQHSPSSTLSTPDSASPITPASTLPATSPLSSEPLPSQYFENQPISQHQFNSMVLQGGASQNFPQGYLSPPPPPPPGALYFLQQQNLQLQQQPPLLVPPPQGIPNSSNSTGQYGSSSASQMRPGENTNRPLFVGNLPFTCQWQELKDLFRSAGPVLRADVAQAEGRSRGFGSVVFERFDSAERAVGMFNGVEWGGRVLKVHFDKFSATPAYTTGSAAAYSSLPSGMYGIETAYPQSIYAQPSLPLHQQLQSQYPMIPSMPINAPFPLHFPPASAFGVQPISKSSTPIPSESGSQGTNVTLPLPNGLASRRASSDPNFDESKLSLTNARAQLPELGRIAMPAPYPFNTTGMGSPYGNPLSPAGIYQNPRMIGLPLMTPSMPAFTLGEFSQMTPPLFPQLFSPGLGAFSPGGMFQGNSNSSSNAAPGAPLQRVSSYSQHNPMFPSTFTQPSYHPMLSPGILIPQYNQYDQNSNQYQFPQDVSTPKAYQYPLEFNQDPNLQQQQQLEEIQNVSRRGSQEKNGYFPVVEILPISNGASAVPSPVLGNLPMPEISRAVSAPGTTLNSPHLKPNFNSFNSDSITLSNLTLSPSTQQQQDEEEEQDVEAALEQDKKMLEAVGDLQRRRSLATSNLSVSNLGNVRRASLDGLQKFGSSNIWSSK